MSSPCRLNPCYFWLHYSLYCVYRQSPCIIYLEQLPTEFLMHADSWDWHPVFIDSHLMLNIRYLFLHMCYIISDHTSLQILIGLTILHILLKGCWTVRCERSLYSSSEADMYPWEHSVSNSLLLSCDKSPLASSLIMAASCMGKIGFIHAWNIPFQ